MLTSIYACFKRIKTNVNFGLFGESFLPFHFLCGMKLAEFFWFKQVDLSLSPYLCVSRSFVFQPNIFPTLGQGILWYQTCKFGSSIYYRLSFLASLWATSMGAFSRVAVTDIHKDWWAFLLWFFSSSIILIHASLVHLIIPPFNSPFS